MAGTKSDGRDYTAAEKLAEIERVIIRRKQHHRRRKPTEVATKGLNVLRSIARDYRIQTNR